MNAIQPAPSRLDNLRNSGAKALADIASGAPLSAVLADLVLAAERHTDTEMLASVLLVDDEGKLMFGAAPTLPAAYNAAIDGQAIGPAAGSCGTAAYYGESVFVDDIKTDPLWSDYRHLALAHGLRACWSTPIKGDDGEVLGTFANYYREPRHPRAYDFEAIACLVETAAKVIMASRAAV